MRRLLALLVVVPLLAVGTAFWNARQGAQLPGWYLEARAAGTLAADLEAAAQRSQQALLARFGRELLDEVTADDGTPDESFLRRIERRGKMVLEGLRQGREVRLDGGDLEEILLAWAADRDDGRQLLEATRAVRAEISGGELELGAVLVPSRLPPELLTDDRRRLLDSLMRLSGSDGEIYLGLRAVPAAADGQLVLAPPLRLRVGRLELSARLLAGLGVKPAELTAGVPVDLGQVEVRSAAIDDDVLVLVVSPRI